MNHGQDIINKSLCKNGFLSRNVQVRNLINESYYFGYKWKDKLAKFTNYTHTRPMYKLVIDEKSCILEKINTYVVIENFKIVNIDVYISSSILNDLQLTSDYQDNVSLVEQYMLDEKQKKNISKYEFKILENDGIFSIIDANYNILKHDEILKSSNIEGYMKSSVNISSLLRDFIVASS